MRLFFGYLRGYAGLQRPPSQDDVSAADALLQNYKDYLRKDRGLTENSVHPFLKPLLPRIGVFGPVLATGAVLLVNWRVLLWMYRRKIFLRA